MRDTTMMTIDLEWHTDDMSMNEEASLEMKSYAKRN